MKKIVLSEEQKRELINVIQEKLNTAPTISIDELIAKEAKSSAKKNEG